MADPSTGTETPRRRLIRGRVGVDHGRGNAQRRCDHGGIMREGASLLGGPKTGQAWRKGNKGLTKRTKEEKKKERSLPKRIQKVAAFQFWQFLSGGG